MFGIEFSGHAKQFLKKTDKQFAVRILQRIEKLAEDPFPTDVKRIVNRKEKVFRVRVGSYRIQYVVIYEANSVFVTDIDKRPRAY